MSPARVRLILVGFTVCCVAADRAGADQSRAREMAVPDAAKSLHDKGREAGSRGNYAEALTLLTKAAELAPDWPYPIYDRAFTHLQMKNSEAALADYRRTLELSPRGFFTAHVAVDALQREQRRELPPGFYLAYSMLEFMSDAQRRQVIPQLVEKFPRFAPAWLEFAKLAETPQERLTRIEAGLGAQPDADTRGMLKLTQALTLTQLGQNAAAESIIKDLADDPATTIAVEAWARSLLAKKRQ